MKLNPAEFSLDCIAQVRHILNKHKTGASVLIDTISVKYDEISDHISNDDDDVTADFIPEKNARNNTC